MRKIFTRWVSLLLLSVMSVTGFAQQYVEIGDGVLNASFPYTAWKNSWAKVIFSNDQVGGAKTVNALALYSSKEGNYTLSNQKVYLKLTDQTALTNAYEEPLTSGYTLLYEGSVSFNGVGWSKIDFSAPFEITAGKNVVILWENNANTALYLNINGTQATDGAIKVSGSDNGAAVGTGFSPYPVAYPNVRLYYQSSGPASPDLVSPVNNRNKINVNSNFQFTLSGAETYNLYLATSKSLVESKDASVKVAANVTASEGLNTYTLSNALLDSTKYYWMVEAVASGESAYSSVWSFFTQDVITAFPYTQGFEDVWYASYDENKESPLSSVINTNYKDSTEWNFSDGWNIRTQKYAHSGNFSGYCSFTTGEWWLQTPRIALPANHRLEFWYRVSRESNFPQDTKEATSVVKISTDGGATWTPILTLSPEGPMDAWEQAVIDLSAYAGDNVYIRWYYAADGSTTSFLLLDDISLEAIPTQAEIELLETEYTFSPLFVGGRLAHDVTIRNAGVSDLVVAGSTVEGPFTCNYSGTIKPGETAVAQIFFIPTATGLAEGSVSFDVGDATGNATLTLSGNALASMDKFFESFDASTNMPANWYALNNPEHQYTKVSIASGQYDANSQPNAAKILVFPDYQYPVTLVTPGLSGFGVNTLKFYAKKYDAGYDLELIIGVLSDPYSLESFQEVDRVRLSAEFEEYSFALPAVEGKPYIGFQFGGYADGETAFKSLRIDDVSWDAVTDQPPMPAVIALPQDNATNLDIMQAVKMQWANGGGNPEGYKFYFGTTAAANEIIDGQVVTGVNTFVEYTQPLAYSTKYYWKVVPYNQYGDAVDCPVWSFTTMTDPTITSFPYTENFDQITNTPGFSYPLGWSVENTNGDGMCWDVLSNNADFQNNAYSAPNAMHVGFNYNPKDDYLFTPPMRFEANKVYRLKFKLHTMMDMVTGLIYTEKLKVFLGNDNSSEAMSKELIDTYVNQDVWQDEYAVFSVTETGNYHLGFYAYSEPLMYLLIIDNVIVEEVGEGVPQVDFEASETSITAGDLVTFTNRSVVNPAAESLKWEITPADFSFEAGTTAESENITVKFRFPGTYSVSLKVTNSYGEDVETKENLITVSDNGVSAPKALNAQVSGSNVNLSWSSPVGYKFEETFEYDLTGWSIMTSTALNGKDLTAAADGANTWGLVDKSQNAEAADYVHGGNRAMYISYTAGEGDDPDFNWLITPEVTIENGDHLRYWIAYLNGEANDGNSYYTLMNIMVKDGADWTSIFAYDEKSPINMMESEVMHDLSAFAGKTIQIGFAYKYNDGYQLSVDDVKVGPVSKKASAQPKAIRPVRNVLKQVAPVSAAKGVRVGTHIGYKVYRNHELIATITDAATTTYADANVAKGQHLYQVTAVYSTPDLESSPVSATVDVTTGIFDTDNSLNKLSIYPNPNNGLFKLYLGEGNSLSKVEVYNLTGQVVYSTASNNSELSLDLTNLAKGVYLVKVLNNSITSTGKVIIR